MPAGSIEPGFMDALVQLSFVVQSVLGSTAARHDLTVPQVRLLGILRDREPGMLQLARHLGLDKSSVTGLIDRAERRGLVRRASTPEDGRAVRVSSTALGRQLIEQVEPEIALQINALGAVLSTAEREVLARLIGRIVTGRVD